MSVVTPLPMNTPSLFFSGAVSVLTLSLMVNAQMKFTAMPMVVAGFNHFLAFRADFLGDLHRADLVLGPATVLPHFVQSVAAEVVVDVVGEGLVSVNVQVEDIHI